MKFFYEIISENFLLKHKNIIFEARKEILDEKINMTIDAAKSIVNFGGSLWWILVRFCKTKLSDEHKTEKSARNFIFLIFICYSIIFICLKVTSPDPLYVVNGIIVSKTEFEKYKPNEIESINEFNEESAKAIYGENGKDGALLMTLKYHSN